MGIFSRLFGGKSESPEPVGERHSVLIHIRLASMMPTEQEVEACHGLQERIEDALAAADAGELDGDEWGEGVCTIFAHGPNAEKL